MEGSLGGVGAQPSLRIELLKLLELTPRVQTSQTVSGDRFYQWPIYSQNTNIDCVFQELISEL
jgi:hypothetical protein